MYSRLFAIALFSISLSGGLMGQHCNLSIEGQVIDKSTQYPLSYVNIVIQELNDGAISTENGGFSFDDLCQGHYHLHISHIGCEPQVLHLDLEVDTTLVIIMDHTSIALSEVVIGGGSLQGESKLTETIGKQELQDNIDKNFADQLASLAGVQVLRNGSGIAKPIVHGLYGNRLTILNNGIVQSGQQWGNDHSPEIDPLVANKLSVVKGTQAIEYGGGNLGAVILVEPQSIGREPHIHGRVNYAYETNGRGNNLNVQMQQYTPAIAWRINGTLKRYGDRNTPDYFLNNTGQSEANLAVQLEKSIDDRLFLEAYVSNFSSELGVLAGSHIGNVTDLELALGQAVPFFTESQYSSLIESPRQEVNHLLSKLKAKYYPKESELIEVTLALQRNNRKEYDVRRSGRSDIPALSLLQYDYTADAKYQKSFPSNWKLTLGSQNSFTNNVNNPETGILPLIPDYFSMENGAFVMAEQQVNKLGFDIGLRYDRVFQNVATISSTLPREIIRYNNIFSNLNASTGMKYKVGDNQSLGLNAGYTSRNPAINELYSNGLHQGVSGIEEGDPGLKPEQAVKTTLEYKAWSGSQFSFETMVYYQRINQYIYLKPEDEIRLTIRGAFPVFSYDQTDAEIFGFDLASQISFGPSFVGKVKYSFLRGNDVSADIPLIYMPPNNFSTEVSYRSKESSRLFGKRLEGLELSFNGNYVFRQHHILDSQDFVVPPDAYFLVGMSGSTNVILRKYQLRLYGSVDNLLNTQYRDYLNRLRYFADDLGRSITLGLQVKF